MGHIPRIFACMKSKNDSIPMSCVQVALVLADSTVSAHHYYVILCVTMSYYICCYVILCVPICHTVHHYVMHTLYPYVIPCQFIILHTVN